MVDVFSVTQPKYSTIVPIRSISFYYHPYSYDKGIGICKTLCDDVEFRQNI